MGMRMNTAALNFKKEKKKRFKYNFLFEENLLKEENFYDVLESISVRGYDFEDEMEYEESYNKNMDGFIKEETIKFLDALFANKTFNEWEISKKLQEVINQYGKENIRISYLLGEMKVYVGHQIVEKEYWCPDQTTGIGEDGRIFVNAYLSLSDYGYTVPDMAIDDEWLRYYAVGENELIEKTIRIDNRGEVKEFESFLENVKAKENDDFFEDKLRMWKIVLAHMKENAKYIYSV